VEEGRGKEEGRRRTKEEGMRDKMGGCMRIRQWS
jgi:hypothetical protein